MITECRQEKVEQVYITWNQCLSQLMLRIQIPLMARCTRFSMMDRWFSQCTLVFSTNKAVLDITEILMTVALHTKTS
jgi:hypothetical protein